MKAYIFCGPTLSVNEASAVLDAVYLPPASQGDVYRIMRLCPQAIGIIDGYFNSVPSVWHKEILWAMREGVHIFGSASMGALRAAELAAFGMEGVGKIFTAFAQGQLTDDDEVAVVHAPAEHGYRALSVAMVNIRATLAAAEANRIIGAATHARLLKIGKELFYPERTYKRILSEASQQGLDDSDIGRLEKWLPHGCIDQKRDDALEMLRLIKDRIGDKITNKKVHYHFEHTIFWDKVLNSTEPISITDNISDNPAHSSAVIEEYRINPSLYQGIHKNAQNALLCKLVASIRGTTASNEDVYNAIISFRTDNNLLNAESIEKWLLEHNLSTEEFVHFFTEHTLVELITKQVPIPINILEEHIRFDTDYPSIHNRAIHKRDLLERAGFNSPSLDSISMSQEELLRWYFSRRNVDIPGDLKRFAEGVGLSNENQLVYAILREFWYVQLSEKGT